MSSRLDSAVLRLSYTPCLLLLYHSTFSRWAIMCTAGGGDTDSRHVTAGHFHPAVEKRKENGIVVSKKSEFTMFAVAAPELKIRVKLI